MINNIGLLPLLLVLLILVGIIWVVIRSRKNEQVTIDENGNKIRSGLGGWLILIGLGVLITPIAVFYELSTYIEIFSDGSYQMLSNPSSNSYIPFWSFLLWFEIVFISLLFFGGIYSIFLFFAKKSLFPKFYILMLTSSLVFALISTIAAENIYPNEFDIINQVIGDIIRSIVIVIIWVPYLLISKRVKATFIK